MQDGFEENAPSAGNPDVADAVETASEELRADAVHSLVREAILRGDLEADVPISQVQLAARLGVSRTPLREALRMLQREGLIASEPNRRVRVTPLSVSDLGELYAARIVIEALATRLSVPRMTSEDLAALRRALDEMSAIGGTHDFDRWETPHREFHGLLRVHAGDRIAGMARELADHGERYRRVYLTGPSAW